MLMLMTQIQQLQTNMLSMQNQIAELMTKGSQKLADPFRISMSNDIGDHQTNMSSVPSINMNFDSFLKNMNGKFY